MKTAIAIFAYRRPSHLSRVLSALEPQLEQFPLPVQIFLDGPRCDGDEQDVYETRKVAESYSRKIELKILMQSTNKGLYSSLTEGVSAVLQDYEAIIVLEDDILTSPHFLSFMVQGLLTYRYEHKVASIHGYCPPIKGYRMPENFFLRGADCWGWATWRNRWKYFSPDANSMINFIQYRGLARKFNLDGNLDQMKLLKSRANGTSGSWAICWHASCFLANLYTLYPGRSLVRNIGLDSSGEHCSPAPWLEATITQKPVPIIQRPIEEDPQVFKVYSRQMGGPNLFIRILLRLKAKFYSIFLSPSTLLG